MWPSWGQCRTEPKVRQTWFGLVGRAHKGQRGCHQHCRCNYLKMFRPKSLETRGATIRVVLPRPIFQLYCEEYHVVRSPNLQAKLNQQRPASPACPHDAAALVVGVTNIASINAKLVTPKFAVLSSLRSFELVLLLLSSLVGYS